MIDTLALAKARFPGLPNSLNALCTRFAIDLSERTTHNALLDCRLLADVYIELTGGRQRGLLLQAAGQTEAVVSYTGPISRRPVLIRPTTGQLEAHVQFLSRITDPLWLTQARIQG
jgi:DNA polymerase-3 subunit epsilon